MKTLAILLVIFVPCLFYIADSQAKGYINYLEEIKKEETQKHKKPILKKRNKRVASTDFDVEKWYWKNGKDIVLKRVMKYRGTFQMTAKRVGLKDWRDAAVIPVIESNGFINITGYAGEKCFFQVKESTAADVAKRFKVVIGDLSDPWDCSYAGAGTLKIYFDEFKDFALAYVAYNDGNGDVRRKRQAGGDPVAESIYDDMAFYIKRQIMNMEM